MEPQDAIKYGKNLISVSGGGWAEYTCTTEDGFKHVRLDDTGYRYGECESTKSMVGCATLNLVLNQKWLPECLAYATTYYEDAEPEEFDKCESSFDALGPQKLLSFEGPEGTCYMVLLEVAHAGPEAVYQTYSVDDLGTCVAYDYNIEDAASTFETAVARILKKQ
nr:MAG TPA: hypothetical protein [Caudoviricetes sp.]